MQRIIKRGEIYHANLNPAIGHEQKGRRPVLVVQNNVGNKYSPTVIVVPITSAKFPFLPTHVTIYSAECLPKDSIAMCEQVRTLDKSRLGNPVGIIEKDTLLKVNTALKVSFALDDVSPAPDKDLIEMCLCHECARQFSDSDEYYVRRSYLYQDEKSRCDWCGVKDGFDYVIKPIKAQNEISQN